MALETILKQPAEVLRHVVRFGAGFAPIGVISASAEARGLVSAAAALGVAHELAGDVVTLELSGGDDGEIYLVTLRTEQADGGEAEGEIEVMVVDGAWSMPDGGAPYLSIAEFVGRFGLPEVIRMTDGIGDGRIDRAMLVGALVNAQSVADAHICARYAVPLASPPQIVKKIVGDLARAELYPAGAPDGVADQAKQSLRMLERIQSGAMPLAMAEPPAEAVSDNPVLIAPGYRAYPDGLRDYGR